MQPIPHGQDDADPGDYVGDRGFRYGFLVCLLTSWRGRPIRSSRPSRSERVLGLGLLMVYGFCYSSEPRPSSHLCSEVGYGTTDQVLPAPSLYRTRLFWKSARNAAPRGTRRNDPRRGRRCDRTVDTRDVLEDLGYNVLLALGRPVSRSPFYNQTVGLISW